MSNRLYGASLLVLSGLVACSETRFATPTSPLPQASTQSEPRQSVRGEIQVGAVTHPAGSTLTVHDCGPSWTGIAGNHVCTEEWQAAFDIVVDRDMRNAAITVTFEGPSGRCGEVIVTGQSFTANRERLVSTANALYMTYEPEGYNNLSVTQRCSLPTTTQKLVVQLWDPGGGAGSAAVPLLRREFEYPYTFKSAGQSGVDAR